MAVRPEIGKCWWANTNRSHRVGDAIKGFDLPFWLCSSATDVKFKNRGLILLAYYMGALLICLLGAK